MSVISLNIKLTDAGKAAIVNPTNIGTAALEITTIELGSAAYDPTGTETALQTPIKTLTTFGGDAVANNVIHVTIRDDSQDTYQVGEIGLWSGSGVLMGVISAADTAVITEKGPNDILLIAADATVDDVDVSNITFGATDFIYPPATTTSPGIVQLATEEKMDAGEQGAVVDAYELQAFLARKLTSALNENDPAKAASAAAVFALNQAVSNINTLLASDEDTLNELQEIVDYIQLNRSDLDALSIASISGLQTALDGKASSSHSHAWSAITGKPSTFTPSTHTHSEYAASSHTHSTSDISGLTTIDLANTTTEWSGNATSLDWTFGEGFFLINCKHSAASLFYPSVFYVDSNNVRQAIAVVSGNVIQVEIDFNGIRVARYGASTVEYLQFSSIRKIG